MKLPLLAASAIVAGCALGQDSARDEPAAVAGWVDRICALPPAERQAELERLRREEGIVINCGREDEGASEEVKEHENKAPATDAETRADRRAAAR